MNTTELIDFLQRHDFTDDQGYNLLTGDIYDAVTEEEIGLKPSPGPPPATPRPPQASNKGIV